MQRLTRIILAVAVTVALAVAFCGLAPVVSAARPRQQAYVPGAGTATLKHRHPHYRHSERLARRVHRRRSTQRHRRRGERRHHPMRHARRRMPARAGPAASLDPLSLRFAPDPMLHAAGNRFAPGGQDASTTATVTGTGDLFDGPPTATNIENLGAGHGQTIVVPLFKLLNELSAGAPTSQ